MRPALGLVLMTLLAFISPTGAEGQKAYRIGALAAEDEFVPGIDGFKQKMAALGYSEGKNIIYDVQNAKGDQDLLNKLAEILIQKRPDLIVTSSTTATVPLAKLTSGSALPVVFLSSGDPLRFVKSYARSGNNLTGVSSSSIDLIGKRIELLKELAPGIKRLIILANPAGANYELSLKVAREAAKKLGIEQIELQIPARNADEVKQKLFLIERKLGDGLLVPPEATLLAATEGIAQQAIRQKLPHVGPNVLTVKRGLLAAYSSDYYSLGQQGAMLVDKILRGAKPTDLPIEQPYRLYLSVNLRTANAIGLNVPKGILLRADEVIK